MTRPLAKSEIFNAFSYWVNLEPCLDSHHYKLDVSDADYIFHKYATLVDRLGSREIRMALMLETKTRGAKIKDHQRETLEFHDQLLRTRTILDKRTDEGYFLKGHRPNARTVFSSKHRRRVQIFHFGVFLLTMDAMYPPECKWMTWHGHNFEPGLERKISVDELRGVLSFQIDPDTFRPIEIRRRKKGKTSYLDLYPESEN